MTNTQNTAIEALEMNYPVSVRRYEIRNSLGGKSQKNAGGGMIREFECLQAIRVTILSERRIYTSYGLHGGESGNPGKNFLNDRLIKGKVSLSVRSGDCVRIETPGGAFDCAETVMEAR